MISIEYKIVSEFDVTRQVASAEVLRRVNDGPWASTPGLPITTFPKSPYRVGSVAWHEELAAEQIKAQIDADRTAALRLGVPYSINGSRFFLHEVK